MSLHCIRRKGVRPPLVDLSSSWVKFYPPSTSAPSLSLLSGAPVGEAGQGGQLGSSLLVLL